MARSRPNTTRSTPSEAGAAAGTQRLQKILAAAGFGSRRACEELITTGRVEVDGKVITELGAKADPTRQKIRIDGEPLRRVKYRYYALHKPQGVVSTARDPSGRPRVVDLVPQDLRVFPVGRLDKNSEGLILLTNDGELANGLTHPRYAVRKVYHVLTAGNVTPEELQVLHRGVHLAEGVARVVSAKIRSTEGKATWLEIVLDEGRNREIRRILARVGHKVMRLVRVEMGGVRLGDMPVGTYRQLSPREIDKLHEAVRDSRKRKEARKEARSAAAAQAVAPKGGPKRKTKKAAAEAPNRPPRKRAARDGDSPEFGRKRAARGRDLPQIGRRGPRVGSLIGLEDEFSPGVALPPVETYPEEHDTTDRPPRRPGRPGRHGGKRVPGKGAARTGGPGKGGPRKGSGGKASGKLGGGKTTRRKTAKPKTVARKTTRRKGAGRRPGR